MMRVLELPSVTDQGTACLAGTSRSVGRGWPYGHFLPDLYFTGGIFIPIIISTASYTRVSSLPKCVLSREGILP